MWVGSRGVVWGWVERVCECVYAELIDKNAAYSCDGMSLMCKMAAAPRADIAKPQGRAVFGFVMKGNSLATCVGVCARSNIGCSATTLARRYS
jgi:hypothetical protein